MRKDGFTVCVNNYVECLRREGRYATAHVYENALRSSLCFVEHHVCHSNKLPVKT